MDHLQHGDGSFQPDGAPGESLLQQKRKGLAYGVSPHRSQGRMWGVTEWGFFLFNPLRNQVEFREFPVPDDELYYITNGVEESLDE